MTPRVEAGEGGCDFSLVVLCYRAEASLPAYIERIHRALEELDLDWEIVLVANYWPETGDTTPGIVRDLAARWPRTRTVVRPKKGGMGWDMRSGLEACGGRLLGVIDGDGQYPAADIARCLARIRSGDADLVKTYRVVRADGLYRRLLSEGYNMFFKLLFPAYRGLHDVNSKPKIVTRDAWRRLELRSDDWFIDAEIILRALALGLEIREIPTEFRPLEDRPSFVRPGTVLEFVRHLLRFRLLGRI